MNRNRAKIVSNSPQDEISQQEQHLSHQRMLNQQRQRQLMQQQQSQFQLRAQQQHARMLQQQVHQQPQYIIHPHVTQQGQPQRQCALPSYVPSSQIQEIIGKFIIYVRRHIKKNTRIYI